MMKPGYRHSLRQRQRGALENSAPDPAGAIADLAHQAEHLEARIQQLKTGIQNLMQLHQAQAAPAPGPDQPLAQAELTALEKAVEDFELELASRVLTWQHLQEPFWQALRYGGLGLLGGWLLHGLWQ
jgi:hypothetical protein